MMAATFMVFNHFRDIIHLIMMDIDMNPYECGLGELKTRVNYFLMRSMYMNFQNPTYQMVAERKQ